MVYGLAKATACLQVWVTTTCGASRHRTIRSSGSSCNLETSTCSGSPEGVQTTWWSREVGNFLLSTGKGRCSGIRRAVLLLQRCVPLTTVEFRSSRHVMPSRAAKRGRTVASLPIATRTFLRRLATKLPSGPVDHHTRLRDWTLHLSGLHRLQ